MADAPKNDPVKAIRGRKDVRRRQMERWGLIGIAVLAVMVLALVAGLFLGPGPRAPDGAQTSVFTVEPGDSAGAVAQRLDEAGLVRSALAFSVVARLSGRAGDLKPGEYEIPSGASPGQVIAVLASGQGITRSVTIPEGWTVAMAMRRIAANELLSGPMPPAPPEGSILPDTYVFQRGETRAAMVQRMQDAMSVALREEWAGRAAGLPVETPQEALVLASIVEKETAVPDERPRVAAVFVNRLRAGMKLQSDPTIIYGITQGEPLRRRIRRSEIAMAHPWNTYVIPALPPTPIANPGRASIAAVLNPPATRELFFVADGTGGHVFAETYAEHNRNVQRWRELRAEREQADSGLDGAAQPAPAPASPAAPAAPR